MPTITAVPGGPSGVYELGGPQSRFRGERAGYSPGHAPILAAEPPMAGKSP
ncbi:hypothetical protein [Nonomuraea sp. NPDC049750]|uniref:hypothetical protein n=1 Tax=Nonomuraea sp. NPDC049750 TaxID=3154738 RepID=UPI0033CB6EA0